MTKQKRILLRITFSAASCSALNHPFCVGNGRDRSLLNENYGTFNWN